MDADRHDKLTTLLDFHQRAALMAAAQREHVTVDQVIQAGLKRGGVPEGAVTAAYLLLRHHPGLFAALASWPVECGFCRESFKALTMACPFCAAKGCPGCVTGTGCPPCVAKAGEQRVRIQKEQAEQAQALSELAAQNAPEE